jgi:metallo-beta-lactamase class B
MHAPLRLYANIVKDFRTRFERLDATKADIVLPSHPQVTGPFERKAKLDAGDRNAFVEPGPLNRIIDRLRIASGVRHRHRDVVIPVQTGRT